MDCRWLLILFTTRHIVILPTANALGYDRKSRMEDGIYPNQDFPYDLMDQTLCMRTIVGQTINYIFRDHLLKISFNFHRGMEEIF